MQPVVHFIVSIGIAFALEIRFKRKYAIILLLGVIGVLPDVDHFLPEYNGAGLFHNLMVVLLIPVCLLMLAILIEGSTNNGSSKLQRFFVCVLVILMGHLMLDIIVGKTIILGLSSESTVFKLTSLPILESAGIGVIFETADIVWLTLGIIVVLGNLAQKKMFAMVEEFHEYTKLERSGAIERDALLAIISRPVTISRTHPLPN